MGLSEGPSKSCVARACPRPPSLGYYAVFDYLRLHDEPEAYRFGIRARETAELSRGTFDEERYDAIAEWSVLREEESVRP